MSSPPCSSHPDTEVFSSLRRERANAPWCFYCMFHVGIWRSATRYTAKYSHGGRIPTHTAICHRKKRKTHPPNLLLILIRNLKLWLCLQHLYSEARRGCGCRRIQILLTHFHSKEALHSRLAAAGLSPRLGGNKSQLPPVNLEHVLSHRYRVDSRNTFLQYHLQHTLVFCITVRTSSILNCTLKNALLLHAVN